MAITIHDMISRGVLLVVCSLALAGCKKPRPGHVLDEARSVRRTPASFSAADEDYFHDMDGGIALTGEEIKGRNTWNVWSAGNDRFWDEISMLSKGNLDFLKTVSSHPKLKFSRDNRWSYLGLVNEPCFERATGPDPERFGLWLDKRRADCPPDPFENEEKYPGVVIGARGKTVPVGSFYGYATGIVGMRLFPNPKFDEAAAAKWDPVRYYEDPSYYYSKDLVKPYRIGMACAFCHVGPSPTNPPVDPENPSWENLSSTVGAQYFWWDRIFTWDADPTSFPYQVFHASRPGSLDTSLVSTDYITNPRTMNAIYGLGSRLRHAKRWGMETLGGGELNNKQFNDFFKGGPLTQFFKAPSTAWAPRVLKDGADSVGALGSLNRVYLNIGEFSEEWLLHFNALVGGKPTSPIEIAVARKNSTYWEATENQTPDTALFFLKSSTPHKLKDAPGGAGYLTADTAKLTRGKEVFAERCARCHSSKVPAKVPGLDPDGCAGPGYLTCFERYWEWTKTDEFKREMREIVLKEDFLEDNFMSNDLRIPVTLLETNACSPLATNALAGDIWEDFSSHSYKSLPPVGTITVHDPITGEPHPYKMPGGGRGYTRVPSLISVWSTAPFLLNNTVGKFNPSPSVEARMQSFEDAIEKMLWPERREKDPVLGGKVPGIIDRTTDRSYLRVPAGFLPDHLRPLLSPLQRIAPWLVGDAGIEIGPIPKGTPVNLLANLALKSRSPDLAERLAHDKKLLAVLLRIKHDLDSLPRGASDEEARKVFADLAAPLLELSQCPDFVVNRGHYFGTSYFAQEPGLSDDDKRALIEFLKTF
ncbi:hypothetical protein [Sorangium sp. So ce145]|uniref:hypothetical protein n=1 Tax=Sorangium sp. So ce145 TaxID=3133285 RepID=UPI003F62967F